MKATTGIFDASLGAKSNEQTGKAIMARQQQSNLSTMHFMDNLERSFRQAGDIIAEVVPQIYDTGRQIQIMGADEARKMVLINKPHKDESGKDRHYDMTKGKYSVVVTMGRAFSTKRMETFDTMQQLVQSAPNLLPMFGDVMFRNSDIAGADIVADRFHSMLPPAIQDKDNPLPPEARAAVAQVQQQAQEMQAQLAQLTMERHAKVLEHKGKMEEIAAKLQADMQLEDKKLLAQLAVAEINTKAQILGEREGMVNELESQFHDQAHDIALQKDQQAHEKQIAAQQAQQQAQLADQQAQNQAGLQAQQQQAQPQD